MEHIAVCASLSHTLAAFYQIFVVGFSVLLVDASAVFRGLALVLCMLTLLSVVKAN